MGFFMRPGPTGLTKPTLESGLTLATASGDIDFDIVNNDISNPAAVDLAFTTPAIQAAAFDQGTAQSPSYVLEAGATRTISLLRDYGAEDYGDGNVTESVNALLPDGTFASQTLTVEPYIDIANAAQPDGFCAFNGTSDYLSTPYNALFDFERTDPFSFACWIYPDAFGSSRTIICHNNGAGQTTGWRLAIGSASFDKLYVWFVGSSYTTDKSILRYSTNSIVVSTWNHVAFTYDGSNDVDTNGSPKIYINGVAEASYTDYANYKTIDDSMQTSTSLLIGATVGESRFVDGEIDDVGVWSRELTALEIADLADNKTRCHKVQRANLVCYYDFDYVNGSLASLDSATGFVGIKDRTPNDFKMWFKGGAYGVFNGSEYLETPNNALFDFNYDDPFSVSLWMKSSVSANSWFITNQLGSPSYQGWGLFKHTSNYWQFYFFADFATGKYLTVNTTSTNLNDGSWHHIVMTYPGSAALAANTGSSAIIMYQDGGVEAHSATTDSLTADSTVSGAALEMGAGRGGGTIYTGQLRDVGIWGKVLSAGNVASLGVPGTAVNTVESANLVAGYTFPIQAVGSGLDPEPDISGNGLDMVKG